MDNKNRNQTNFKKTKINFYSKIFLFFILVTSFVIKAQNVKNSSKEISFKQNIYKTISFGDKILFGNAESTAKWIISNSKENIVVFVNGNQINDYVFEKPGIYEINYTDNKIHNDNKCNHAQFEAKMLVQVSPVKMTFDFAKIKFSEKIRVGSDCEGILISVPVNVVIKENLLTKFIPSNFMVAGIGSNITAKSITQEIDLKTGIQFLQYKLSGIASKETYLMFDFIDYNKNVQTYNQPEIVN